MNNEQKIELTEEEKQLRKIAENQCEEIHNMVSTLKYINNIDESSQKKLIEFFNKFELFDEKQDIDNPQVSFGQKIKCLLNNIFSLLGERDKKMEKISKLYKLLNIKQLNTGLKQSLEISITTFERNQEENKITEENTKYNQIIHYK